jgi:hypothetical protein
MRTSFDTQPELPNTEVMATLSAGIEAISRVYEDKGRTRMVARTVDEVTAEVGGEIFTQEMIDEISDRLARRALGLERDLGKLDDQ